LHTEEHGVGADILIKKLQDRRPRIVCFVGMGIWKAFFQYLTAFNFVGMATPKVSTANRKRGAAYSPEDALMPYKLVHFQQHHKGVLNISDASLDDGHASVKREDSPAVSHSLLTVELETDGEQPMCSLDDNKIAPVTETLFFVMPNTSGLVAGYKVCRRHSVSFSIRESLNRSGAQPADYANFIVALKQRVFEGRAGILNTSTFTEIRQSQP
jgi:G:T/U-mismatch repair DNA glycosylase